MTVKKIISGKNAGKWKTVHGHAESGHPIGSTIAVFPTKKRAEAQHRAIMASKAKRKGK